MFLSRKSEKYNFKYEVRQPVIMPIKRNGTRSPGRETRARIMGKGDYVVMLDKQGKRHKVKKGLVTKAKRLGWREYNLERRLREFLESVPRQGRKEYLERHKRKKEKGN